MKRRIILAVGADVKNKFLIGDGKRILREGPLLGDLGSLENFEKFENEIERCGRRFRPSVIACDLHPGYYSTRWAEEHCRKRPACRLLGVQHHQAHLASVLGEHRISDALGVSFDGTGYGLDGHMWGGEFFRVRRASCVRLAHVAYMKMPGGEKAILEPWRMALSIAGPAALFYLKQVPKQDAKTVSRMLSGNIHVPLSSSAGRLFDAAAALLGLCAYASYEAEGPIRLEKICEEGVREAYTFAVGKEEGLLALDPHPAFLGILKDLKKKIPAAVIAAKFHNAVANAIVRTVDLLSARTHLKQVVLSGGVFQNSRLKGLVVPRLFGRGYRVFMNERLPVNDLNVAWGQYYVSCHTRQS